MKVKDFIEKLKKLDQEAEVIIKSSNFELGSSNVLVSCIAQYNEGSKRKETFRDAFDGGAYQAEVWRISGGDIPVVYIS